MDCSPPGSYRGAWLLECSHRHFGAPAKKKWSWEYIWFGFSWGCFCGWASQVVQWWRICLPMQETRVQSSVREDSRPQRRKWPPTPVFLPGKSHGQRSLSGYSPKGYRVRQNPATKQQLLWLAKFPIAAKLLLTVCRNDFWEYPIGSLCWGSQLWDTELSVFYSIGPRSLCTVKEKQSLRCTKQVANL